MKLHPNAHTHTLVDPHCGLLHSWATSQLRINHLLSVYVETQTNILLLLPVVCLCLQLPF